MERYDVAVVGGGTSGLTALRQLSNLGKQAVLIEAGRLHRNQERFRRNSLL